MKCVVTGGSGFIGSHVIEALRKAGHEVSNIDVNDTIEADHYFDVDIRDVGRLKKIFSKHGKDAVFHLAAVANARQVLEEPTKAVDINVTGTAAILEAALQAKVKRTILASTVWFYNATDRSPKEGQIRFLKEDEAILPQGGGHVYTTSKIAGELLCHDFCRLYGLNFTILRYGIPYGPRMWPGLALRSFLNNAFSGKPIKIFGDGSAVRRFLYVGDLAQAHVLALSDKAINQTYNIEGDKDITIKELATMVAKYVKGAEVEYIIDPSRKGELKLDGVAISNKKAKSELGWDLAVSLEEGIRQTVEWYQKECLNGDNANES